MSKSWVEVSNDGVNWMRLPGGATRVEPNPYRYTRTVFDGPEVMHTFMITQDGDDVRATVDGRPLDLAAKPGEASPGPCDDSHCWKCHIEVTRTTSRCLCHSCCDALEDGDGRATVLAGENADLRDERAEMLALLRRLSTIAETDGETSRVTLTNDHVAASQEARALLARLSTESVKR